MNNMAIVYVDVVGEILAGDGTPAVGTVQFQIPQELRDVVDNIVYAPSVFTAVLDISGQFTLTGLPSTDSPDVDPSGWLYRVHVHTDVWAESFSTSLPAAFAPSADFADLIPAQVEPCTADGTPCATLAQIAALQASVIDLQAQIDAIEASDVESVNGQTGVVVLGPAEVGADAAGSAGAALVSANTYTDTEISALDSLVVHLAGAETITGAKTFTALTTHSGANLKVIRSDLTGGFQVRVTGGGTDYDYGPGDIVVFYHDANDFGGTETPRQRWHPGGVGYYGDINFGLNNVYGNEQRIVSTSGVAYLGAKNGLVNLAFAGRKTTPGAPVAGTWDAGDMVFDSNKVWWRCSVSGTPGVWV